jgi:hypothetical protein
MEEKGAAVTISLTIEVPDKLGQTLQKMPDRIPEILERGLVDLQEEPFTSYQDEEHIIALLASQPTPQQILALQPSPTLQKRVRDLLISNQQGVLTGEQTAELDRYMLLEHLVRLAKIHASRQLLEHP